MVWPRAQIIDYTHYTYFLEVGHKTRKPIPKNPIFNIFLPYTNGVWIAITITIIITSAVFATLGKFNRAATFNWHDFIIMPTSMLMECGIIETAFYRKIQRTKSGFIMVGFWVIAVFFLVKAYESNLLASILAKVYEDPIDSFQGNQKIILNTLTEKIFPDMLKSDRPVYYTRGSTVVKRLGVS